MSATVEKPVRKFPPPCWTQDEALALIEAYKERWYALRRGYLRTADWDAVADAVGRTCPGASPAKTSAQCRHKMEKLRQRYRAEKQRALSFPVGRFFSSWFYFEAMDAMEGGGSNAESGDLVDSSGMNNSNNSVFVNAGLNPGRGIRFKPVGERNLVTVASRSKNGNNKMNVQSSPNYGSMITNAYGSDKEHDDDGEYEDEFLVETPIDENLGVSTGYRAQNIRKSHKISSQNFAPRFQANHHGSDGVGGFRLKTPSYQDAEIPNPRPRKFSKIERKPNPNFWGDGGANEIDTDGGEVWVKMPRDRNFLGSRGKYSGRNDKNSNPKLDSGGLNGFSGMGKKTSSGVGREDGALVDMVSSIRLLGDGFLKMEKMKMEMAREIEKMRMESEMKRNELILESQKQIVDAFVKGLIENKKQQLEKTTVPKTES